MPEWEEGEHSQAELNPIFLQVIDLNGRVIFRTANLVSDILRSDKSTRDEFIYSGMIRDQHIRQGQFPVRNEFGKVIGMLLVAISEEATFNVLKNLRLALLISFPALLIIIFFCHITGRIKGDCSGQ